MLLKNIKITETCQGFFLDNPSCEKRKREGPKKHISHANPRIT